MWITVRTRFGRAVGRGMCRRDPPGRDPRRGARCPCVPPRLAQGLRLFELDLAGVLDFKQDVILAESWRPSCERIVVAADLSEDWRGPLLESGLDTQAPVAWIAEGLLAYLSPTANDALVAGAAGLSPPGSRFGLTWRVPGA